MNTILTAAQINRLAQRLSDKPLGRSASATSAAERLQRLLAVRIGGERAAASRRSSSARRGSRPPRGGWSQRSSATVTRQSRKLGCRPRGGTSTGAGSAIATEASLQPEPAAAPGAGRMRTSKPAPARRIAAAAGFLGGDTPGSGQARRTGGPRGKGDVDGLRAVEINPVSSSPKAMALS